MCKGTGTVQNDAWKEFWQRHKGGDWLAAIVAGNCPADPPEITCEQCGGDGFVYTRAGIFFAHAVQVTLRRLGVAIPKPVEFQGRNPFRKMKDDPYPPAPAADQGSV
jgi:hypothetical protein